MVLLWVLIGGLVAIFFVYELYLAALPTPLPGIPYNKESANKLFGDVSLMKSARYRRQWIWTQPQEHGTAVSQVFMLPFRKPTVVVSDYREVIDICSRRSREFDKGTRNKEYFRVVAPNFHFTLPTADPIFKSHKKLVRNLMTTKFLSKVSAPRIYEEATNLISLWELKASKAHGNPFEAGHDLYSATLDMICGVAFGMDNTKSSLRHEAAHIRSTTPIFPKTKGEPIYFSQAQPIPELEALLDMSELISIAQASPFPAFAQLLALLQPRHARAHWNRKTLIMRQIDRSIQRLLSIGVKGCESALDQLLWREMNAAKEEDRLPDYYSPVIRDEILGYLLAGHDTTAATMSWWVKYMSAHQPVQARLRDALQRAHSDAYRESRPPTMEEISEVSVPYLDAVVEETLRFGAVATLIARTSNCDTQILGYPIPKGTDVYLCLTGPSMTEPRAPVRELSRSLESQESKDIIPNWDDDASEFKPERWLKLVKNTDGIEEEIYDQNAGPTLAFSAGPRQCFGKRLAYMKLRTIMTLSMWNFEFQPLDESLNNLEIHERLVNLPRSCYVKLQRRNGIAYLDWAAFVDTHC